MATEAEAKIEDGGLAFPGSRYQQVGTMADHGVSDDDSPTFDLVQHPGMSLRDWFAGQALVGLIPAYQAAYGSPTSECMEVVREAYGYADCMLAARKGEA
jgi:hypothetical protein